jgi:hypothetical protein
MAPELTAEQKAKEARAEKIAWLIIIAIIAAMGVGFFTLGLTGIGIVAVALVPVIYLLLIVMAGGKG